MKPLSNEARGYLLNRLYEIERQLDFIDELSPLPEDEQFTDDIQQRIAVFRERWKLDKN